MGLLWESQCCVFPEDCSISHSHTKICIQPSLQLWSCHPPDWKQPHVSVSTWGNTTRQREGTGFCRILKRQEDFQSTGQRAKKKKPDKKSCVPCDPIYMRFWKWHNYRNSRWALARGWRWKGHSDGVAGSIWHSECVMVTASVHLLIWTVLWQRITSYVIIMVSDITQFT